MARDNLSAVYREYIDCLNNQEWGKLGHFVHENVQRNGKILGLSGYRKMLEENYVDIPDLKFNIEFAISEPPFLGSRLLFDCTPVGEFLGLQINGKRVSFSENVFYKFLSGKIGIVWSVVDKDAIEAQL